jgi:hypothetical protein
MPHSHCRQLSQSPNVLSGSSKGEMFGLRLCFLESSFQAWRVSGREAHSTMLELEEKEAWGPNLKEKM